MYVHFRIIQFTLISLTFSQEINFLTYHVRKVILCDTLRLAVQCNLNLNKIINIQEIKERFNLSILSNIVGREGENNLNYFIKTI